MSDLRITPKQKEIIKALEDDTHTEIFFGGSAGGSKSFLGCLWQITRRLKYPGSRGFIARAQLKSLKESTLLTFFEVARMCGLVMEVDYKYNAMSGVIRFSNGSEEYLRDLFLYPSDPEFVSLGSTEYTDGFIDEMAEITEQAYQIIRSRIRYKLHDFKLIPKLAMGSNPCKTFIYREFYKKWVEKKLEPYKAYIPASVYENPFMPDAYIENLKKLDNRNRERLLNGNWNYDDDPMKLFDYDKILDIFSNEAERGQKYCIIDMAGLGRDKTVISFWEGMFVTEIIMPVMLTARELDEMLSARKIPSSNCLIDETGVGFGIVNELKREYKREVRGFVAGSIPIKKEDEKEIDKVQHNYRNLRSQCWFTLAKYVNSGLIGVYKGIPMEVRNLIVEDLEQMKQVNADKDTTLQVITKDEIKEKGGLNRSTDCFIEGTKVLTNKGEKNIEDIKIGDKIITPYGTRKVMRLIEKNTDELYKLNFSDGNVIYTTGNHRIYTTEGFKKADVLMIKDRLDNDKLWKLIKWRFQHLWNIKERNIGFRDHIDTIMQTGSQREHCIMKFGKTQTKGISQKDTTFTILMETLSIIRQKILSWSKGRNTRESILLENSKIKSIQTKDRLNLNELENLQRNGINQKKGESGIENNIRKDLQGQRSSNMNARFAEKNSHQQEKIRFTPARNPVLTNIEILKLNKREKVYNITLDKDNVYYANGILVSNCGDAMMMRMYYTFEKKQPLYFTSLHTPTEAELKRKPIEKICFFCGLHYFEEHCPKGCKDRLLTAKDLQAPRF